MKYLLIIFAAFLAISCCKTPKSINFGSDNCAHCGMTITDAKWGAELVTDKGKCYKFDSIECLLAYYFSEIEKSNLKVGSFWTVNYLKPGELIKAETSVFVKSDAFHSPMGFNAASFAHPNIAEKYIASNKDELLNWNSIKEQFNKNR